MQWSSLAENSPQDCFLIARLQVRPPQNIKGTQMGALNILVPATLKSGLNSGFSRADSIIDSISSFFLCDCEVVCLHILIRYGEVFVTVFLKYGAICIECNADVGMSENFLQNLCGHTRFDAPCRISVSE